MAITINVSAPVYLTAPHAPQFRGHVGPILLKRNTMPLEVSISTEEKVRLSVTPTTHGGAPASLDGAVSFSVQDGACAIEPIDDTSAFVVSGDAPGDSIVMVSADAD